ncbi:hypothetical protein AAG742_01825 [Micrococcus sp. 2A]|nr:hypothetical protein [uncultured Micrococcus sp.]
MSTPTTEENKTLDNALQQVRFHMDRAERFQRRAEKAEAELARLKDGDAW